MFNLRSTTTIQILFDPAYLKLQWMRIVSDWHHIQEQPWLKSTVTSTARMKHENQVCSKRKVVIDCSLDCKSGSKLMTTWYPSVHREQTLPEFVCGHDHAYRDLQQNLFSSPSTNPHPLLPHLPSTRHASSSFVAHRKIASRGWRSRIPNRTLPHDPGSGNDWSRIAIAMDFAASQCDTMCNREANPRWGGVSLDGRVWWREG